MRKNGSVQETEEESRASQGWTLGWYYERQRADIEYAGHWNRRRTLSPSFLNSNSRNLKFKGCKGKRKLEELLQRGGSLMTLPWPPHYESLAESFHRRWLKGKSLCVLPKGDRNQADVGFSVVDFHHEMSRVTDVGANGGEWDWLTWFRWRRVRAQLLLLPGAPSRVNIILLPPRLSSKTTMNLRDKMTLSFL